MAGGIFTERPFEPNPKCILLGFIFMLLYWFIPDEKNVFMLPVIFIVVYVLVAWYDFVYHCDDKMFTGTSTPVGISDSIFKPQRRNDNRNYPRDKYLVEDQEGAYLRNVYLFHLIIIMPLLGYIGYMGTNTPKQAYAPLLGLSILGAFYHGTRLFTPRQTFNP